jgi:hypothetical protein
MAASMPVLRVLFYTVRVGSRWCKTGNGAVECEEATVGINRITSNNTVSISVDRVQLEKDHANDSEGSLLADTKGKIIRKVEVAVEYHPKNEPPRSSGK